MQTENYIHRAYYGVNSKNPNKSTTKALHINDQIKVFSEEIQNINEKYDFLCEYVHPNFGSNALVSSGTISSGKLNPSEETNREHLDKIRSICSFCMLYLNDDALQHLSGPLRLKTHFLDHFFKPGAKINNIFSTKTPHPIGDGRTKSTAFYFTKARSAAESVQLTYEYFNLEGYIVFVKKIGDIDDKYFYDVFNTNKGEVWVKTPRINVD